MNETTNQPISIQQSVKCLQFDCDWEYYNDGDWEYYNPLNFNETEINGIGYVDITTNTWTHIGTLQKSRDDPIV